MTIKSKDFISEAIRISEKAEEQGILLRLLGALAFRMHCPKYAHLLEEMDREISDIDYVGSSDQRKFYKSFMQEMGYEIDRDMLVALEGDRFGFKNPESGLCIDIFVNKLNFCHTIWLKDRLNLEKPTIPLADMLMEKMQIVALEPKDVKDTLVLLLEHDLAFPEATDKSDKIDVGYLCKVLSDDWGFYYTFTKNLQKCKNFLPEFTALNAEQQKEIHDKIDAVLSTIENAPKTFKWRMRSMIGTKKKWYRDVGEKESTF